MMKVIIILYSILFFGLLQSCLPTQEIVKTTDTLDTTSDSEDEDETEDLELEYDSNFIQLGDDISTTSMSMFSDYSDTFLIRGNSLIAFIKNNISTFQTHYCLVTKFENSYGSNAKKVLVLSGRIRSYYNSNLQAKEYFLQVNPNNKTINQNDCLTVTITEALNTKYSTSDFAYSINELCPECVTNITSTGLNLYNVNASIEVAASISHLSMQILPEVGSSTGSVSTCSVNSDCTELGYNCCLANQCVNHGEVRSDVDQTGDAFLIAKQVVASNPSAITNYQDIFYICPQMVPVDTDDEDDNSDPYADAEDLLTELTKLYNCTTPQVDEFSICVKEFTNASMLMNSSSYSFTAEDDDINFSSIALTTAQNNIVQIDYAGNTYFKEALIATDTSVTLNSAITLSSPNDTLTTGQSANFQLVAPSDADNDTVSLYYKVDGTCTKLGSSLAKCTKYYTQGQLSTPRRSSDHISGNQSFILPNYADTTYNVIVSVSGSTVAEGEDTWSLNGSSVIFNSSEFPIYDGQKIEITYYVTNNVTALTSSKSSAQAAINEHCTCDENEDPCWLEPNYDEDEETITNFTCKYPEDESDSLLQTTFYLNTKTVPQKFFNESGANFNLQSESTDSKQEGELFEYDSGDSAKPNNVENNIGFNEIYGSMNIDSSSPRAPKMIEVEKGKTYDIYSDDGAFSTCTTCGNDYYTGLQKIFPNNYKYDGAGYTPDLVESSKLDNGSDFTSDDMRFGRACFVPATMIPWTHVAANNVNTQRRNRMAAQHFLFANGYNKDWYGFDYGSLIGSFDGVKWFSIGSSRRIVAESNKLYIAVNAYFGDLTTNNTYKVTISEMASVIGAGSAVTHDTDSDGAQCQKMHYCEVDTDCISQLGYDYTCESVAGISTPWPSFDDNGNEITGSLELTLSTLVDGTNGEVKRCVYRGQGSLCQPQYLNVDINDSYANSTKSSLHACSPNTYCAELTSSSFNNRISRYALSLNAQNNDADIEKDTDTFGLGARIIGRPYEFYGSEGVSALLRNHFQQINISALCVPGKDPDTAADFEEGNSAIISTRQADKVNNIGRTIASTTLQDSNYLAFCPATDEDGNYTYRNNITLSSEEHAPLAIRENMSSNLLILSALGEQGLFNDGASIVSNIGYGKNSCLRTAGSHCFSDFECAPNSWIADKFNNISNFNGEISDAEINFWQEELVCRNSQAKYDDNGNPNSLYELNEHKCCSEIGNTFTYEAQPHEDFDFQVVDSAGVPLIPGVNQPYNSSLRYSRTNIVYDKLISEPSTYPSYVKAKPQPSTALQVTEANIRQYNTLHLHNSRMCCTGNWVRKYASGTNGNGGGYTRSRSKLQNFDLTTFKALSWNENNIPAINTFPSGVSYDPTAIPYTCTPEDYSTADCEVKNLVEGGTEETTYLNYFAKFELLGIPQVLIETNETIFKPMSTEAMDTDNDGTDDIASQQDISSLLLPLDNTIKDINNGGVHDVEYNSTKYYSAASYDNFEIGTNKLKKVFDEDEFKCCIPTGYEVSDDTSANSCCTGTINQTDEGIARCCLPDYTDLSVYTNRYVSSEGAYLNGKAISDNDIDPTTGYIKQSIVKKMAATMCCSGTAIVGKVIGDYLIPIDYDSSIQCSKTRRWIYNEDLDNLEPVGPAVDLYNYGPKWNNHVYCVPEDFEFTTEDC